MDKIPLKVKRVIKTLIFILLLIICDQLIGKELKLLFFRQKSGQHQTLTYTLSEVKSDILILGHSRAQNHYVSQILSDSLKMSCFNAGIGGGYSLLVFYGQLKAIVENYTPKMVILEMDPGSFDYNQIDYEKLSILLPYVKDYPCLHDIVKLRSPYENIKLLSTIYPYNSEIYNLIRFNTTFYPKTNYNGYVPKLSKPLDMVTYKYLASVFTDNQELNAELDINKINIFKKICEICKKQGIRLVLVCSPFFQLNKEPLVYPSTSLKKLCFQSVTIILKYMILNRTPDLLANSTFL